MPRLNTGSAYQGTSLISGAQRSVNLYSESNQGPITATLYPRPGLTPRGAGPPAIGQGRCLYAATNGDLYAVVDQVLYYIDPDFVWHSIGTLTISATTPVIIADNGQDALVVDGSPFGLTIDLQNRTAAAIVDPNFLGGKRVTFLNFFLLLDQLNSPNFYSTEVTSITFNALAFGSLTQFPGNVVGLIASEAALWVFSRYKGEVWADAGTSPFAFQVLSGIIIEFGLVGPYAICRQDKAVYWMGQSQEGGRMALRGVGNAAQRFSTHAIEQEWLSYSTVDDCIVTCYQIRGHEFVCFDFPTADRTWVFDEAAQDDPWHEEAFYDTNGVQHRTKDTFKAYAYSRNFSLDWSTGMLYERDTTNFSDNGIPCVYLRDCPHLVDESDDRVTVWSVIADVECGNGTGQTVPGSGNPWALGFNPGFGPALLTEPPFMTLYISHDRGKSYYAHSDQMMAGPYGFNTQPAFYRCGVGFDTVIRFQWTGPFQTALNGGFITTERHDADE